MFGYISHQSHSVVTGGCHERSSTTAHAVHRSGGAGLRLAIGTALVAAGHRIAGELPTSPPALSAED